MSERITQAELARRLGVSKQAVNEGVQKRRLVPGADGLFDAEAAIARWRSTAAPRVSSQGEAGSPDTGQPGRPTPAGGGGAPDYHRGRAVREAYLAQTARLDYEEREGRLVKRDDVALRWAGLAAQTRQRLEMIPDRLEGLLGPEALAELRKEIRLACSDLAGE